MTGYIIETSQADGASGSGWVVTRWIGITPSPQAMLAQLPGWRPTVVERGDVVFRRALILGLKLGEVR